MTPLTPPPLYGSGPTLRNKRTGSWSHQNEIGQVKRFDDFETVDWVHDALKEHRQRLRDSANARSRVFTFWQRVYAATSNWLVLAVMGIIIGVIASCLNVVTAWLASIRLGRCRSNFLWNETFCCWNQPHEQCPDWVEWSLYASLNYFIYIVISVALALAAALLVKYVSPAAAGLGISEIKCIVSGFIMRGFLGWRTLFIKSSALPLAIGSGLSVGKEGPSVHYAVCVGNCIASLFPQFKNSATKYREFLTATSAAGVAVAFGSPMGGVLFSVEEISSDFLLLTIWKSYFCAMIAVTTLAVINPFRTGQLVLFEISYDTDWHYFEIPVYIIIGIFGGCYGIIVSYFNIKVVAFRKKFLANYAVREVILLAFCTAILCYFNPFLKLDMTELMQILFHECDEKFDHPICDLSSSKKHWLVSLVFATVLRMIWTIITYGCRVPAGIFVPSMAAGATFGRALGIIADTIISHNPDSPLFSSCAAGEKCIIPGTYAFLGAAAALSGITHMTVTVAIIMFELTGALRYIIPTMIVIAVTKSINDKWGHGGIADQMIKFNGLPLIDPKEEAYFDVNVDQAMTVFVRTFSLKRSEGISLGQLRAKLLAESFRGYPIVDSFELQCIAGFVSRADVEYVLGNYVDSDDNTPCTFGNLDIGHGCATFAAIVDNAPLSVALGTSLEYVLDIFIRLGPRYLLVLKNNALEGLITRKDVLRYEYTLHYSTSEEQT